MGDDSWDWVVILKELASGAPTLINLGEVERRSRKWPTCACGQLCAALPRKEGGQPCDWILTDYGIDFGAKISNHEWNRALEIFQQIEERVDFLLREQRINELEEAMHAQAGQ